jgi:hypothetical protein
MSFFSKLFSSRLSPVSKLDNVIPHPARSLAAGSAEQSPHETRIDWRTSEGHQRLLLSFTFPNAGEGVPKWTDWGGLLGESLNSAIQRLKTDGALLPVNEPARRILYNRSANELRKMCRDHGLKVPGTKEQLAERLVSIDPRGLVLGYPGELLRCSHEAEKIANVRREAWKQSQLDDPDLRHVFDRQEFEAEKEKLKQQFLSKALPEPSDDDVKWGMLNCRALQHATEGNLGLCRNMYLVMADFLSRREKLKEAFRLYLTVCAYDLNGAQNRGGTPSEMLQRFPLFDPTMAMLAPAVVESVQDLAEELSFSVDDVRRAYLESAALMDFPLAPGKVWSVLSLAIEGKIDLGDQPRCFRRIRELLV